jgi:hypothetical protein
MIRMDKLFASFLRNNYKITYGWNGSTTQNYSQILREIQQKIVRFPILIYNLETSEDFDE